MIPTTKFAVSSVQVSQLPIGCDQIEGIYNGASAAWLQVHDACIAPQTGAVPLYELPLSAATQFQETLQVARLELTEGLFVGVSSTEGTYTASASVMDITVWTDVAPLATNVVGDKTTNTYILSVWANSHPEKRLYGVIVRNTSGAAIYVYANAIGSNLYTPEPGLMFSVAAGATKKFYFGANKGICPTFVDINNFNLAGAGNIYNGLSIYLNLAVVSDPSGYTNIQFQTSSSVGTILAITN